MKPGKPIYAEGFFFSALGNLIPKIGIVLASSLPSIVFTLLYSCVCYWEETLIIEGDGKGLFEDHQIWI